MFDGDERSSFETPGRLCARGHCCHRGTDLSYGRLEDGGLRCIYHGWLYDVNGKILEQPGEPNGGGQRHSFSQPSFPCRETGGIVLSYIGPGDPPLLPNYEFLHVPDDQRFVSKIHHSCNYLQSNEGNIDPVHLSFLHRNLELSETDKKRRVTGSESSPNSLFGADIAPRIDVELTDSACASFRYQPRRRKIYFRTSNFIMPQLTLPRQTGRRYSVNCHVPSTIPAIGSTYVFLAQRRSTGR